MIANRLAPRPGDRVLLAGDAASLINPLTGEGTCYALLSGRRAGAAAVERDDPSAVYRAALAHELGRHLRHTTVLIRLTADRRMLEAGVSRGRPVPLGRSTHWSRWGSAAG